MARGSVTKVSGTEDHAGLLVSTEAMENQMQIGRRAHLNLGIYRDM